MTIKPCLEKHYVGENGTLFFVDCGLDVSEASVAKVLLERPDGTIISKPATIYTFNESTHYIYFQIEESDFNQEGEYLGQAYIEIGSWSGWGKAFSIDVLEPISSSSSSVSSSSSSSSSSA